MEEKLHTVQVWVGDEVREFKVQDGANLRRVLLANGLSPYAGLPSKVNCRGRGLCATCGVWIEEGEPKPHHWHDQLAAQFGYPRLSCQITVNSDITVRLLTDKVIWGSGIVQEFSSGKGKDETL